MRDPDRVQDETYRGKAVVLVNGYAGALVVATQGWEDRPVQSPCLLAWLASQDSFGTPYTAPVAPFIPRDLWRDSLFRQPWGKIRRRSATYRPTDPDRTGTRQTRKYEDGGER